MATAADKGAVSDEKAADTAEAYEQASGTKDKPVSDSDPVIDSINEAVAALELDEPAHAALINPEYEKQRAESFRNRGAEEDEKPEPEHVPDADYEEVGSFLPSAEAGDGDNKGPAKKTAAKKS